MCRAASRFSIFAAAVPVRLPSVRRTLKAGRYKLPSPAPGEGDPVADGRSDVPRDPESRTSVDEPATIGSPPAERLVPWKWDAHLNTCRQSRVSQSQATGRTALGEQEKEKDALPSWTARREAGVPGSARCRSLVHHSVVLRVEYRLRSDRRSVRSAKLSAKHIRASRRANPRRPGQAPAIRDANACVTLFVHSLRARICLASFNGRIRAGSRRYNYFLTFCLFLVS